MATNVVPNSKLLASDRSASLGFGAALNQALMALASLRLTVALFAMSIFLILAGTFAQVNKDIWDVIRDYFRTPICWIDFQLFFPPSFFQPYPPPVVPGGFYFPGGWLIGGVMGLNLIAAHTVRFKVQTKGARLWGGLALIAVGMVLTWLVVSTGHNQDVLGGGQPAIAYPTVWLLFKGSLGLGWLATLYGLTKVQRVSKVTWSLLLAAALGLGVLVGWMLIPGNWETPSDASMRILWQLAKGGLAGLILLLGCILAFRKRAGIVLLHGGIGLMMSSELMVGLGAVEGQMHLVEGKTSNFVSDIRTWELAIIDSSDKEKDHVVTVSRETLLGNQQSGGLASWFSQPSRSSSKSDASSPLVNDGRLPVQLKLVQYLQNSSLASAGQTSEPNLATAGVGKRFVAVPHQASTGTDSDSKVDVSAAYVQVLSPTNEDLGTYLVGVGVPAPNGPQTFTVNGKTYEIEMRFKRTYKPYAVTLLDVRKDDYVGTTTPRNYSSDVHIFDESRTADRDVKIWMNNPLRFAGETFYQSGYHLDKPTGEESTTLSVVTNQGWMVPYVGCMIVAIGMLAQFSIVLARFLSRVDTPGKVLTGETLAARGALVKPLSWTTGLVIPAVLVSIIGGYVATQARLPKAAVDQFNFYAAGQIPVAAGGRIQPLDSVARNSLLAISGKHNFVDANDKTQPAIKWLLDLIANREVAAGHRVFRVENLELQSLLGLEKRERFRYSLSELLPKFEELKKQAELAREARAKSASTLSVLQRKVLELENKVGIMDTLVQAFAPPDIRPENIKEDLMAAIQRDQALAERRPGPTLAVPPVSEETKWQTFAAGWTRDLVKTTWMNQPADPNVTALTKLLVAYSKKDAALFNSEVAAYRALLEATPLKELSLNRTSFEAWFNHAQLFSNASVIYLIAFLLAACGWLGYSREFNRASLSLILLALTIHTVALVARIYISGRPPVTNLYSSAVFIGWGTVGLGLLLELIYRLGIGNIIATVSGFSTLLIAQGLGADGDTFEVLQAVLDTQFWLATHVTCITFGYATTYVAGLLGLCYVLTGLFTNRLTPALGKEITRMTYGTLCFSIFFSFVGTVLGGLWADDSWGRFWGWDPKENGALIIVLWNALCLHARWGGMVKDRGLALLAIGGNIAVSWSWFGVNELGVGLHAYGFREGLLRGLGILVVVHLAIIAAGLIPRSRWLSKA